MRVIAYDETGNHRVPHEIGVGDILDWKRDGYRGFVRGQVFMLNENTRCICITVLLSKSARGRTTWITDRNILRVYVCAGNRKSPTRGD